MNVPIRTFYALASPEGYICSDPSEQIRFTNTLNTLLFERNHVYRNRVTEDKVSSLIIELNRPIRTVQIKTFTDHVDTSFDEYLEDQSFYVYVENVLREKIFQNYPDSIFRDHKFNIVDFPSLQVLDFSSDYYRYPIIDKGVLTTDVIMTSIATKSKSTSLGEYIIKNFNEGYFLKPLTKEEAFIEKLSGDYSVFSISECKEKFFFDLPELNTTPTSIIDRKLFK